MDSEELLEKQAQLMLRGLHKHKREYLCLEFINLCQTSDWRTLAAPAPAPAMTARRQAEQATLNQAEEWEEAEESDWSDGGDWRPPPAS